MSEKVSNVTVLGTVRTALVIAALVVFGVVGSIFEPYRFIAGAGEKSLTVLGSLFIIALFVERAQQVYIDVWRGIRRTKVDRKVERAEQELAALVAKGNSPAAALTDARKKTEEAKDELAAFRADTRKLAFICGMAMGIAISLVGPRLLGEVLEPWGDPGPWQDGLFNAVDVVITGGLIGGGSEGIHQLVTLITDFLEQTRRGFKKPGGSAPDANP